MSPNHLLRGMRLSAVCLLIAAAVLYTGDYLSVQFQIPHQRPRFGSVQIRQYYAVPQKGNRTEFLFQPPTAQPCVNAIFPHFGATPCWYLARNPTQRIDVESGSSPAF